MIDKTENIIPPPFGLGKSWELLLFGKSMKLIVKKGMINLVKYIDKKNEVNEYIMRSLGSSLISITLLVSILENIF